MKIRTPELIRQRIEFEHRERLRKAMEEYERKQGLNFCTEEEFNARIEESKPKLKQLTFLD